MKKVAIIGLIVIGVVLIGCAIMYETSNEGGNTKNNANINQWEKKAPQLFNNVGYAKLEESVPYVANQSESMAALIGPITNPFGIRDDILDYIIKTIPASNESAMRAAIKMMQYEQQVYYGNPSESEALILDSKDDLAGSCLASYLHQTSGQDKLKDVLDVRDMRMQLFNTKAREKRMWDVANKYFAWHVLGSGLSTSEEIIACEKGEF